MRSTILRMTAALYPQGCSYIVNNILVKINHWVRMKITIHCVDMAGGRVAHSLLQLSKK